MSDIDKLREASRREYLHKREQKKLADLEESIKEDETALSKSNHPKFATQLERKRELLRLVHERSKLDQESFQGSSYFIPQGSVQENAEKKCKDGEGYGPLDWENRQIQSVNLLGEIENDYELIEEDLTTSERTNFEECAVQLKGEFPPEDVSLKTSVESLPIFLYKDAIVKAIEEYQILIIVGETGSGKTTQLPQYLHEAGYTKKGIVGCTQPRRVAAMSVAKRVSEEMHVSLGSTVGYSIRFEDCTSRNTIIKYMTDGMLLREFMIQPDLSSYSCIIIDEAHERTIHTDVLFGLLKDICRLRPELKLLISSATLDAEKFSAFFDDAPIFKVPGRRYPVDIYYTKEPEPDYLTAIICTIFQIHLTQSAGDILVFLTGQEEIEMLQERITILASQKKMPELIVLSIYSSLPAEMQAEIFKPTPEGSRKVILATNIAETSITIDGVSFVIDPGFVKQKNYNARTGMESLTPQPCSQASADQRAGRAGRVGPGKCFRLYTKWSFENELLPNNSPEILRSNLGSVVLSLKSIGVDDLMNFDFLDPPPSSSLIHALNLLYAMAALDSKGNLTVIGKKMAEFPLDPMMSRMLIASEKYNCTEECLSISAMLQVQNSIFHTPRSKRRDAEKIRKTFVKSSGDHITLLNVWEQWVEMNFSAQWCFEIFIQVKSMRRAREVRRQLKDTLMRLDIKSTTTSDEVSICKAIASGFFYNTARLSITGDSYRLAKNMSQTVYVHPTSAFILKELPLPKWIVYYELVLTRKEYLRQVIEVRPEWLIEVAPHFFSTADLQQIDSVYKSKKYK